jgi:uncharacterized membrane protein YfcA
MGWSRRRAPRRPAPSAFPVASVFFDISLGQLGLIAAVAMFAAVIGGVAGYGTGALMPLVLVPIVGPEPVVPIIALSALATNAGRATAYRNAIDARRALIVLVAAAPTCALGAYGYTRLSSAGALLVIGTMMVASVPLRRLMRRRGHRLGDRGLAAAAVLWGILVGGTSGSGIILLSMLMAAGLDGMAVIATDAAVTIAMGVVKVAVFGVAGVITAQVVAVAALIGVIAFPGAFVARALVERLPVHLHAALLDAVVMLGGAVMIIGALRA